MKKIVLVAFLLIFIVPIEATITQDFNNDHIRPKVQSIEIGSLEYTASASHTHDLSSPFSIYVYIDGFNEIDSLIIDWNNVIVYLQWSYINDAGSSFGPFAYELLSPTTVGTDKRYHFPIPDQDGVMDIYHPDMTTGSAYYKLEGNQKSTFGAGKVYFHVWTQLVSDPDIQSYYYQYDSNNPMVLTYASTEIDETEPPLQPPAEQEPVGLEGFLQDPLGTLGDVADEVGSVISNNPILVPAVILIIGGLMAIIFISRQGGLSRVLTRIQGKPAMPSGSKPTPSRKPKSIQKKSRFNFGELFKPPQPTGKHQKRRKKRRMK